MIAALTTQLRALASEHGFIPLHTFMSLCAGVYYSARDPLGARGDFTTAPEVSPLFGEAIALHIAAHWRARGVQHGTLFEAGAGRGTLMRDITHVLQRLGFARPNVVFFDCNSVLIQQQKQLVPWCTHVQSADAVPTHVPVCIVANEFFDALPVACDAARIVPQGDEFVLQTVPNLPLREYSPHTQHIWQQWCGKLQQAGKGSLALIADYGYMQPPQRLTVRGFYKHTVCALTHAVGQTDVTADVDFGALCASAQAYNLQVTCAPQSEALQNMGIVALWQHYAARDAALGQRLASGLDMLLHPQQMGQRFYVLQAVVA